MTPAARGARSRCTSSRGSEVTFPTASLPYALPAGGTSWAVADRRRVSISSDPAAGGTARAAGQQLDLSELWLVDRAVVSCDSTTPTRVRFYASQVAPAALLSGSSSGNFDEAEYPPDGLLLQPGEELLAVWSNASDGARGTAVLQVRVLRPAG